MPLRGRWAPRFSCSFGRLCSSLSVPQLPALCEMVARNEHERLRYRFKNLAVLTGQPGSVYRAWRFALCNSLFVQVWTRGKNYLATTE